MRVLQRHDRRFKPPARQAAHADGLDYPARKVGTSPGGVAVYATTDLGQQGVTVAQGILSLIDVDLGKLQHIFGTGPLTAPRVVVANLSGQQDGSGGAYHWSCKDTTWYVDCCITDPAVSEALAVAEAVESFEAIQGRGWDCGNTNGEGLSRTLAEVAWSKALDAYSTAAVWLDGSRPNYIDSQQGSDSDAESNGCAVLFLWWLFSLGFSWEEIAQAGGSTLAACYEALAGKKTAWADFSAACQSAWPQGKPSGVSTDNPWPSIGSGGGGGGGGGGDGQQMTITLTNFGDCDGTYMVTELPADFDANRSVAIGPLLTCIIGCVLSGGGQSQAASSSTKGTARS